MRFNGRRRFAPRQGYKPTRVWAGISGQFAHSAITANALATLVRLEAPASLSSLEADPPEDLTILRIRGNFNVTLSAAAAVTSWTLGLIVQDHQWTQGATFLIDSDKRWLWTRTFDTNAENATFQWLPPGMGSVAGTTFFGQVGMTELDISPKVKVEAGRALYLAAYETASGRALTVTSADMRVLFQRSRRR